MKKLRFLMFFITIIIVVQAFAINSFASTTTTFDHKEATALIGFLFNVNPDKIREKDWSDNTIYKLLTGQYQEGSQEEDIAKIAFLSVAYENINLNVKQQDNIVDASRAHLLDYLEKHASEDISGDVANGIIKNILKSVSKCIMYELCGWDGDIIETFELTYDAIKDIKSLKNKSNSYAEKLQAAVMAGAKIASSEKKAMYMYFREYINACVSMGEHADLYMEGYNYALSNSIIVLDPILNWRSENNLQTLKRWAKYISDIELSLSDSIISSTDFVAKFVLNYPFAQDIICYTAQDFVNFTQNGMYDQERTGYIFEDWYYDAAGTIEYDGNYFDGMVLYAKWKRKPETNFTITFNSNCPEVENFSYVYDTTIGNWLDYEMTRPGYVMSGWYWDSVCTQPVTETITVNRNLTFYAKWEPQFEYSISNEEAIITKFLGYRTINDVIVKDIEVPAVIDGYKVVGIAKEAFYCCNKITTVKLPDGIKNIGDKAFYGCSNLISINIPDSVVSIGEYAFFSCVELVNIELPDSVKSVGKSVFNKCENLKNAILGNGLTSISSFMFAECNNLESVNIGENVSVIEDGAFIYCYKLKEISFPKVLTKIGKQAFQMCKELKYLCINGNNVSIGEKAFMDCDGVETLEIGSGVKYVGDYSFLNCSNISSLNIENGLTTIGHQGFDGISIEELKLPESITTLGPLAFSRCKNLKSVYLGKNLSSIESNVFSDCPNLVNITVNSENKKYCSYNGVLFNKDKTKIYKYPEGKEDILYMIPDSVTVIGGRAFHKCKYIENIVMPEQLKNIEDYAFYYCSKLKSLTLPDTIDTIGGYAFAYCSALNNVSLGGSLKKIGQDAFFRCVELETIIIPNAVTSIGTRCFDYCSKLKCIIMSSGITEIGIDAFKNCDNLSDVYYKENKESWDKIAIGSGNENLINLNINYNCKYITDSIKVMYDGTDTIAHLEPNDSNYEKTIIFALYENEILADVRMESNFNQKIEFKTNKNHDTIKFIVLDSIESLVPLSEAEVITTVQWNY